MAHSFLQALASAIVLSACSDATDVVAVGQTRSGSDAGPGGLAAVETIEGCEPGSYLGQFQGSYGAGQYVIDVTGAIHFELTETLEREFLILSSDSRLSGRTTSDVDFSADVVSDPTRGCREGRFEAQLANGQIAGGVLTYEGSVEGSYDAELRNFRGTWLTWDPNSEAEGFGTWTALHTATGN